MPTPAPGPSGPSGAPPPQPLPPEFYLRDAVTVARELLACRLVHRLPDGARLVATIVETEAYRQSDPASHSHRGPTARTQVMFGPPGHAYVYLIYGIYDCFNIVCEPEGEGAAVLIRAVEPVAGWRRMWELRFPEQEPPDWLLRAETGPAAAPRPSGKEPRPGRRSEPARGDRPPSAVRNLTSGPGKLCRALGITRAAHDGVALWGEGELVVMPPEGWRWDGEPPEPEPPAHADEASAWARPWTRRWPLAGGAVTRARRVGITKAAEREWRFFVPGSPFVSRAR